MALDVLQFRIEEDRRVKHDGERFLALSVDKLPFAPRVMAKDMTRPSRSGSIAGFVTWAKRC